jgi:hypothetical protein
MPVDRGVCDVVQDRHIGHPANPYTVGAEDRPPKMLAQKHWRIGDHSQYSPRLSSDAVTDSSSPEGP